MDFDSIVRRFAAEGLRPPAPGASEAEVQAWLDRVVAAPATATTEGGKRSHRKAANIPANRIRPTTA